MHLLIAAGGHAKVVAEALPDPVAAYVDRREADWLDAEWIASDEAALADAGLRALPLALGIAGTRPDRLEGRLKLLEDYLAAGFQAPPVIHPAAVISPSARIEAGAVVLAGTVVQPHATVGRGCIVNTRAIVEHDCAIGAGSHLAPGAIVLGNCKVGRTCMIGAGAVVLPGSDLPDGTLVKAATRYPE
ncbi:MAG: carbonic anhydrase [Rhodospirillales bacterium]|nr:carbonic anhydrase [Rhodospirillales bacterium]MDH3965550.1 carbonic anhydrase [Rhodospirillales bacterium]